MNNLFGIRVKGVKTFRHSRFERLLHAVLVPSALALIASGFYMSNPSRSKLFNSMDNARKTHFVAQYWFAFYYLTRAYYAMASKGYRKLLPGQKDIKSLPRFTAYELLVKKKKPAYPKYNPGQKMLFAFMAVAFPWQIISGASLYSSGKLQRLSNVYGGLGRTRTAHYLGAVWLTMLVAGHMYFAVTESWGKLKSIVTGYFKPK